MHVVDDAVKIEGRQTKTDGLTVTTLNLVAVHWMNKIHPKLLDIVLVEYSTRLKGRNGQLAALVPDISKCIDALLSRHDLVAPGGIRHVTGNDGDELVAVPVNRVNYSGNSSNNNRDSTRRY